MNTHSSWPLQAHRWRLAMSPHAARADTAGRQRPNSKPVNATPPASMRATRTYHAAGSAPLSLLPSCHGRGNQQERA